MEGENYFGGNEYFASDQLGQNTLELFPGSPRRVAWAGIQLIRRYSPAHPARPHSRLLEVPLDRPLQPFIEVSGGFEIEFSLSARDVQAAARLTVRLTWIPYDLAAKASQPRDQSN
jgi:hypothetical protein